MACYLSPLADVVFKKIFGDHPHLLKSFLNAVLPLPEERQIVDLEYLPSEQVPEIPDFKRTIVDVKCRDQEGQIFIVEMQVEWDMSFMQRLLFGAARAYVKQLKPGECYKLLNPVYGLGLIDSIFDKKTPNWYHHYGIVKLDNPAKEIINGLTLVFVELPKVEINTRDAKKLKILWLRFLKELGEGTQEVPPEFLTVPEIQEAVKLTEQAAYTPGELESYEHYWKQVSSEKSLKEGAKAEGREEGLAEGIEKGREAGFVEEIEKGREEGRVGVARNMKLDGIPSEKISKLTGLSIEEIERL